jgi:very-short-patch-repair endonuclease
MENHTPTPLIAARQLRQEMTLPELLLWKRLRGQPMGVKFRKQHPVEDFVVDFYCAQKRLAIELDGIVHSMGDRPQRDTRRDHILSNKGIDVFRIAASDVLRDVDGVADFLVQLCLNRPPPSALRSATSPKGGGMNKGTP